MNVLDKPEFVIYRNEHFFVRPDGYPVSPGHMLIVTSREDRVDYFDLTEDERTSLADAIRVAKNIIEETHSPDGYNIGMNCGEAAGQTVMYFHCHLIPRYRGDMENPRGGVRHCINGKGNY